MIPQRKTAPRITKEKETEICPQQKISEGGKNSEGGETIKEKNKHLHVGSETQQGSARDKRQENRKLTKQVQHQMEQIRAKNKLPRDNQQRTIKGN